jgi:hypothetical protein
MVRPTPYVAALRVYQPLSAFSPAEQERWRLLHSERRASDRQGDSHQVEQNLAVRRVIRPEPPHVRADGAHFLEDEGRLLVCPWSTATRCWSALEDFRNSLPPSVSRYFLPPGSEDAFASIRMETPAILTETWVIPPRWFALFQPDERERGRDEHGAWVRCRTQIRRARKRVSFLHETVRMAFGPGPLVAEIAELAGWLEEFHPESIVELDYGGLAEYLDQHLRRDGGSGIEEDTSIEDVAISLAGLSAQDGIAAGVGYQRLMERWRSVAVYEHAT